jgi:phage tail-like protein
MTNNFVLWEWFEAQQSGNTTQLRKDMRGNVEVVVLAADHVKKLVSFSLQNCLITKLKAPALNAKDGMVAVEEMQLSYESMTLNPPKGGA